MVLQYVQTQRVAFTAAHIQLACDGVYLALPFTRTSVGVWSLQDISCKPLELVGHSKVLTSLALGNVAVPKLIVSVASDYVIVWNLHHARQQFEKGETIKGRVIGTTLGHVQYSSFSPDDSLVAVCTGFDIIILSSKGECQVATLQGHNGNVTGAEFCPHYTSTLVSISDDRTFKAQPISFEGLLIVITTGFIPLSLLVIVSTMVMWESSLWLGKNIPTFSETEDQHNIFLSEPLAPNVKFPTHVTGNFPRRSKITILDDVENLVGLGQQVWNLDDLTLVYQSPILTASPFLCIAMSLNEPQMAIGAADGVIRVFDLADGNDFRCLHQTDMSKHIVKEKEAKVLKQEQQKKPAGPVTISSRPTWKQAEKTTTADVTSDQETIIETGHSILGLFYTYTQKGNSTRKTPTVKQSLPFLQDGNNVVKELLDSSTMLCVGTTSGLLQVNTKSFEITTFEDFQEPVHCPDGLDDNEKVLNAAGSVLFGQNPQDKVWCIIGSPFQNLVHILVWDKNKASSDQKVVPSLSTEDALAGLESGFKDMNSTCSKSRASSIASVQAPLELTVLSKESLFEDSPLRSELTPRQKDPPERKPNFVSTLQKGKILNNQPLTFKSKVKSSGYTEAPRMSMFKPKTSFSKSKTPIKSTSRPSTRKAKEYPMQSAAPTRATTRLDVADRPTPVNAIRISEDGHNIACALGNKSALVFPLPLSQSCTAYTGHNHMVTHVDWSHTGSSLLTSSDDKSVSLWLKGQSEPIMNINTTKHNFSGSGDNYLKNQENKPFSRGVRFAQFYFMDKFILLCSANTLYMYKYYIDTTKNDIQRYLSQSKYKIVDQWTSSSQSITAMSAVNSFMSYIVFCAGSNKSIDIYDMNVGEKVRQMTDVHSRPVHAICQNMGSAYVSHPSSAYDLFATSAAGDCIKLWDLRSNRCVRRYEGHVNRVHPCGLSISPCGRFIATGSEDKCTYIFDMRSGTYLHKLPGQTDVVSDVAFHPSTPQLYISTLEGKLQLYTDR